jgi:hypothetical protein
VTLQMLWGKLYSVQDEGLMQSTLRAKAASFDPFVLDFASKIFGVSGATLAKITQPGMVPDFNKSFAPAMEARWVQAMNVNALRDIAKRLNGMRPGKENGLVADNAYLWIRDGITLATTRALFGVHDPFSNDESLVPYLW